VANIILSQVDSAYVQARQSFNQSFRTLAVSGQSDIVADSTADTLTLVAGTGITLTTDAATDTLTITSTATGGGGLDSAQVINLIDSDYINARVTTSSQNVFSKIAVSGQGTVEADSTGDTLTLVAGSNITLTTNASTDTITINSTGGTGGTIGSANQVVVNSYIGDSSTTNFTLSYEPAAEQLSFITINGVAQHVDAYSISGTTLTLSEAPDSGDAIEIRTLRLQSAEVELRDYATYVYQPSSPASTFQDSDINDNVLAYDIGKLDVFLNGVRLVNGLDYTATTGTSITLLGDVADSGDTVAINSYAKATVIDPNYQLTPGNADFTTTDSDQVVTTFSAGLYRTAKFIVQLEKDSDSKYHATEILLTHNGSNVFMTEYATITTDSSLGTFDADILGGNVRLLVTPTLTNVSVKTKRISIGA
jgi:hypothetical protein